MPVVLVIINIFQSQSFERSNYQVQNIVQALKHANEDHPGSDRGIRNGT